MIQKIAITLLILSLLLFCACQTNSLGQSEELPVTLTSPTEEIIAHNREIKPEEIDLVQLRTPENGQLAAIIQTSAGSIYVALYPQYAPLAVENFVAHAQNGFYEGANFTEVVENFYIQTGAPAGKENQSALSDFEGNPRPFRNETSLNLWHFRGALAMRNQGPIHPESNTSEFFIVQSQTLKKELLDEMAAVGYPEKVLEAYRTYSGIPGYDMRFTVFGMVYSGLETVDAIAQEEVSAELVPLESITIEKITIGQYDSQNPESLLPFLGKIALGDSDAETSNGSTK